MMTTDDESDELTELAALVSDDPTAARETFVARWRDLVTESPERVRAIALDLTDPASDDAELTLAYAASFHHAGGHRRAIELLEGLLDDHRALSEHSVDFEVEALLELAAAYRSAGRLDDAARVLAEVEASLSSGTLLADRVRWSARARHDRAMLAVHQGQFTSAELMLEESPPESTLTAVERSETAGVVAFLAWTRGAFATADDALARRPLEHTDRPAAALAFASECLIAVERGLSDVAVRAADAAERAGLGSEWEGFVRYARATTALLDGDTASAINELERAERAVLGWQGTPVVPTLAEGMRAVMLLHMGRVEAAMDILRVLPATENHSNCPGRFRAAMALLRGDAVAARAALQPCLELGPAHSERTLVDVLMLLSAIEYHDADDTAGDLAFDRAVRIAIDNGMQATFFLLQLSLLERMVDRAMERPQPDGVPEYLREVLRFAAERPFALIEPLSDREREVAQMAAEGHTVAAIAADLWISHNTAKSHLRRIYRRLAVSSRSELRARLRALGLEFDQRRGDD